MSTPDARLNAAERAALADLEAAAAAADPSLAARLRGGGVAGPLVYLRAVPVWLAGTWTVVLGIGWWSVPLCVAGTLLMLVGLSAGLAISFAGAVVTTVGLGVVAEKAGRRVADRRGDDPSA